MNATISMDKLIAYQNISESSDNSIITNSKKALTSLTSIMSTLNSKKYNKTVPYLKKASGFTTIMNNSTYHEQFYETPTLDYNRSISITATISKSTKNDTTTQNEIIDNGSSQNISSKDILNNYTGV